METNSLTTPDLSAQNDNFKKNIKRWYGKRTDKDFLKSYFEDAGNCFTFSPERKLSGYLHIYLAMDDQNELHFYTIEEKDDKQKKFDWLATSTISGKQESLPHTLSEAKQGKDPDRVPYGIASKWVANWMDSEIREKWLDEKFSEKPADNNVVMAFRIKASDFSAGEKHMCFLALKEKGAGYKVDIVVYNTARLQLLNPETMALNTDDSTYEDLARPVPPFDQDYEDYGVFVDLNIK